jgi:dethiobiotin synthetase
MPNVVILGTGTGVGKTYITRDLINLLVGHLPHDVLGLKPIESGVSDNETSDAAALALASRPVYAPTHAYALKQGLSPHLAAQHEGVEIAIETVVAWVRERTAQLCRSPADAWVLVETAGGAFTPLNPSATNVSLAAKLEPAIWVLVAPDRLGVLHDLSATLLAMQQIARKPDIVLLNAPELPDASTGTNREQIERLGITRITGRIERNASLDEADRVALVAQLSSDAHKILGRRSK